jgi:formylglycine-generating enzyme required for sulfatase activity
MHGNVWEWCEDSWHPHYTDAPTDGSAWLEGGIDDLRVLRGGAWYVMFRGCASRFRCAISREDRHYSVGLRLVLQIGKEEEKPDRAEEEGKDPEEASEQKEANSEEDSE